MKSNLRTKISKRIKQSEIPIIVYVVIILSMALLWRYRHIDDLALDFFAELFGAAFTLFIIHTLLVNSKTKRWKVVREDVNYLISRTVNRIRDGLSIRAFGFSPNLGSGTDDELTQQISVQRNAFLDNLFQLDESQILKKLNEQELFSDASYDYFNEKADDIWAILNIKYSDYFHPELVSLLIDLHIHIKDFCAHIRQHSKTTRYPQNKDYYLGMSKRGVAATAKKIVGILNRLKEEGYSEPASFER